MRVACNELATTFLFGALHCLSNWAVVTILILEENMGVSVRKGSTLDILT